LNSKFEKLNRTLSPDHTFNSSSLNNQSTKKKKQDMEFEIPTEMLHKVGIFVLIQALVYLILSNSSNLFSTTKKSFSFRQLGSFRMRRMEAFLSDMPQGGEPSPMAVSDKME
jgi:hypothetical protein